MKSTIIACALGFASTAFGYLATTTRYYDGQEGACGCGSSSGPFSWQLGITTDVYTAAGSQALFDTVGASWCGAGCGKCYNLTSTGTAPCSGCGEGGEAGESIIVMVTNLCPNNGNEQWCPVVGGTNDYGYSYHFDIMAQSEVFGDNPVVDFEPVACPGQATSSFDECVCHGELETDLTPSGMNSVGTQPAKTATTATTKAPTTTKVATTTSTTAKATTTSSSSGGTQPVYGQCGGKGWTGATVCASGSTCKEQNEWYSQCLPN